MFNSYCRQLLALPYLPSDDIRNAFDELEGEATTDAQRQLCTYIRATWLESTVWSPSTWSVFGCSVRSNNDVEGWHRRLNAKAQHGQLNLYLLLSLLASEAAIVNVTCHCHEGVGRCAVSASVVQEDNCSAASRLGQTAQQRAVSASDPACCQPRCGYVRTLESYRDMHFN